MSEQKDAKREVEKLANVTRPEDLDSSYVNSTSWGKNLVPLPILNKGANGNNQVVIKVPSQYYAPCKLMGTKTWGIQDANDKVVIQGSLPARTSQGIVELRADDNTMMKLKVERGLCRNDYFLQDMDGNLIARSKEPTIPQRLVNAVLGPFVGYTILTGVDAKDEERWVIRICGAIQCPDMCKKACDDCTAGKCDCGKCQADCKAQCETCKTKCLDCCNVEKCKADCMAKCDECKVKCKECLDCKAKCEKCKTDCEAKCQECKTKCEECKAQCLTCKGQCEDCLAQCKSCDKDCCLKACRTCSCFTMKWKQEIRFWRPWDLECKNWQTKVVWEGTLNCAQQIMPDYTMTVHFTQDSDIVDKATMLALAFYCDEQMIDHDYQLCPSELPDSKSKVAPEPAKDDNAAAAKPAAAESSDAAKAE